jgi:hypothetical protein
VLHGWDRKQRDPKSEPKNVDPDLQ